MEEDPGIDDLPGGIPRQNNFLLRNERTGESLNPQATSALGRALPHRPSDAGSPTGPRRRCTPVSGNRGKTSTTGPPEKPLPRPRQRQNSRPSRITLAGHQQTSIFRCLYSRNRACSGISSACYQHM